VRDYLPNALITFDKFHILKIINEGVDAVRRAEASTTPLLKNARYVFLKNEANLTAKQKEKKQELQLSKMNLKSMEALRMRENFQAIYHASTTRHFAELLKEWIEWVEKCGLPPMEKVAHTLWRHWDGIVRWKESQINNGILEGLNSVIQAAKRKARGYAKTLQNHRYLITGKLNQKN
jgi:transposase